MAYDGSRQQLRLAEHFGVAPAVAHRALADVETLAALWPHLLRAAGTSVARVLASSPAAGLISSLPGRIL